MNFVQIFSILILLLIAVGGLGQGGRVLLRREGELAPGVPVRGRWAGLLGLVYLSGGLAAGAVALFWLLVKQGGF